MQTENHSWSYNEFIAFLLICAAEMNSSLSKEELSFIEKQTGVEDILKIKTVVDSVSDASAIDIIDEYRKKYLATPEKLQQAKNDLENLLNTPGLHSQLQKAAVHILEKFLQ